MHTLFYSNISEFAGNLQEMPDEVTYKTLLQNIYKIGPKEKYFNSAYVSMLSHGCGVSQYSQFYEK